MITTTIKQTDSNKAKLILEDISREIGNPKLIEDLVIAQDVKDGYPKPCQSWSYSNRILMIKQGTQDARGKNQWIEFKDKKSGKMIKHDRTVIDNYRPIVIYMPRFVDSCKKCEVLLYNGKCNNCGITKADNKKDIKSVLDGFMQIPLIRVEDTAGKKLPEFKPKKRPNLEYVAKRLGVTVHYNELAGAAGYYAPNRKEIHLASTDEAVFFHELAHAIDHKLNKDFNKLPKAKVETIAEITACVLARMYGIECIGQSQIYLSQYVGGKQYVANMTMGVLNKVGNILDFIFDEEKPKKKGVKK